jgi:mRNA interferase MazF
MGSAPGFRRPALVVQSDKFNGSGIATAVIVALTTNLALAAMPGNVLVKKSEAGLPKDSVVNVSQIATIDKSQLGELAGELPVSLLHEVDVGLRLVLAL